MVGYCLTGQSPQRAVVLKQEEEDVMFKPGDGSRWPKHVAE
jgi:hypothetical protein